MNRQLPSRYDYWRPREAQRLTEKAERLKCYETIFGVLGIALFVLMPVPLLFVGWTAWAAHMAFAAIVFFVSFFCYDRRQQALRQAKLLREQHKALHGGAE